ncbi:NAD(P)-dependent oxidoreductase [Streptomyces hokutonensis]|uniref:NAD(P)-dependent oxidoreductase n=1 Tax=Streptomyces hokutonensis TaxID=1306990 RepID=UPI0033DA20A7
MPACRPGCRTAPRCPTRHTAHGTRHTARGTLADRDALAVELRTGPIRAVLDVTEPEIADAAPSLRDLPDVVLTPHIAARSAESTRGWAPRRGRGPAGGGKAARRPPGGVRRAVRTGLIRGLRGLPSARPGAYGAGGQAALLREPAPASAALRGLPPIKKSTRRKSVRRPY